MELRVLHYFLTVAKEQSFTKAAAWLHITQPTLSRQLAALEEELGTKLFHRNGRNVTLTDEGILLKRRALEIHTSTVIAWRRNIPYSRATRLFLDEIHAFEKKIKDPAASNGVSILQCCKQRGI